MNSSNDNLQHLDASQSTAQNDPANDRQLELEIRAFAELILDIYEYQYRQKRVKTDPQSDI